jgi:hypothetical protein
MIKNLVVISDLHINSTVGLSLPKVGLDDGGEYTASRSQKWLYENWMDFWSSISELDGELIVVINGDLLDVNKHSVHQLITLNKAVVLKHVESILEIIPTSRVFILRGTGAHVGACAELEEIIAAKLQATSVGNTSTSWTLALDVDGVLFDIAHHGRVGSNPWNRSGPLNTLAAQIVMEAHKTGSRIPDVVLRSHNHTHADTHDNLPVRVISTPAWQLSTEYSHRLGLVNLADIGGLVFRCEDGYYDVTKYLYKPEPKAILKV